MSPNPEKRRFIRIEHPLDGRFSADGIQVQGEVANISLSGLLMACVAEVAPDTKGRFVGVTRGGGQIAANARVVRSGTGGMALNFTAIDLDSFEHLRNLVRFSSVQPDADGEDAKVPEKTTE